MSASASARLGDFVEILSGFAFDAANFSDEGEIALIRIRDVLRGRSNTFYRGEYDEKYLINQGEILIGMDGEFNRARWQSAPALLNQRVCKIRSISPRLAEEYLFHFLPAALKSIEDATSFVTVKHLSAKQIREVEIPLPPVEEQRRIAAILDQAETLRTQRHQALAHLDTLTQSLFLDMFGDDAQGTPRFPVAALVDVLETPLQNGAYYPKEDYTAVGGVEMVHMSDAFNGIVHRGGLKRVNCSDADLKKYSLGKEDILLARRSLTYEGAAKPCLIPPATEPLLFESSFIRVTPDKTKLLAVYLFHYSGNETIRDKRVRPFVTQSTISGINQSNLERVLVVVPPLPLQQTFATRIQAIASLKAIHRAALAQLDALFASLQQRAFAGEL
ncbi:MAG: restriction endonuclease subunit S [Rhodoferax sp.]|uniref:restriction endonuclease subunit S n=1 Tax=Rhodoferax sp. TaxID=50421 RepID=UPI002ACD7A21|nr:restriction endonuclease subunit S [Rhodoferax sp.]MDZ7893041.1 restriction endonuclease subunit S [Rhodoferax sp.]